MPKVIDLPTATTMDDGDYLLMEESTGGTKKITRANALSPIGTMYSAVSSVTSVSGSNATVNFASVTVPAGTYVVCAQCRMQNPNNETVMVNFEINDASSFGWVNGHAQQIMAPPLNDFRTTLCRIFRVTQQTTFYLLGAKQGSAITLDSATYNRIYAVKISN